MEKGRWSDGAAKAPVLTGRVPKPARSSSLAGKEARRVWMDHAAGGSARQPTR